MREMIDDMIGELIAKGTVKQLCELPESVFNIALERIRRAHLELKGYRYLDPDNPAGQDTPEG